LYFRSNAEDELVFFELVNGQTQHTNKELIFTLEVRTLHNEKKNKQQ
jgi:hypothetical protein